MRAFSLIELMVVIAIVAVLSAVAVPAYSTYVDRAKMGEVQSVTDGIVLQAIDYRNRTGNFPNARDLGLPVNPSSPGDVESVGTAGLMPDVYDFYLRNSYSTVGTCASSDMMSWDTIILVNDGKFTTDDSNADGYVYITYVLLDRGDDAMQKVCGYSISNFEGSNPTSDPYSLFSSELCTYSDDFSTPQTELAAICI